MTTSAYRKVEPVSQVAYKSGSAPSWLESSLRSLPFEVVRWSAWSPSFTHSDAWIAWAKGATDLHPFSDGIIFSSEGGSSKGDGAEGPGLEFKTSPSVAFLPRALRKRLSAITKIALYLYREVLDENERDKIPLVLSSRFGEMVSTVELLESVGKEEASSPMAFSRSVHNFAPGLCSIANSNRLPHSAVAAMGNSFAAGLLEAALQLYSSDYSSVLYIFADDMQHDLFRDYVTEPPLPYGLATIIRRSDSDDVLKLIGEAGDLEQAFTFLRNLILSRC